MPADNASEGLKTASLLVNPTTAPSAKATQGSKPAGGTKPRASPVKGPPKGLPPKLGERALRLIIVGHNPSEQAWHKGAWACFCCVL